VANQAITVTKNFDLNKISLDLTKELNRSAQIIKEDHFQRLEKGQGVKGALKPSKKKSGKTLVESGKMRNLVIEEATKQNQEAEIHPGEKELYPGTNVTMADVGAFHQEGAGDLPVREWFGITKKAVKRIMKMVELEIERQIKRA
jgi:phage gpG-like protein|tara:strand:+ start:58 stop:492 length:435 start_codon:yes stop_codon:yes gene_type:complete